MRPIKLAVILDQEIHAGGGFQQALNAILLIQELLFGIGGFSINDKSVNAISFAQLCVGSCT